MSLFDRLVSEALRSQTELSPLRTVVEKELLHHDILREMSTAGLLEGLTFIGGTCLRACYGSNRLSEDLDFTGGANFTRETLIDLGGVLVDRLQVKYNLSVGVSEPVLETGNVDIWKLKVSTHPQQNSLPVQRIHIDICAVPSYDRRPMMLRNHYGVEMGTSGLIIQAQSREEILADKMVAFAFRANRIKNRDLWDIGWLKQHNVELPLHLMAKKRAAHRHTTDDFIAIIEERNRQLHDEPDIRKGFIDEMRRFLPPRIVSETVANAAFWSYLTDLLSIEGERVIQVLKSERQPNNFIM
jgi:predicted nucleotidyltransferase component of viral defense system